MHRVAICLLPLLAVLAGCSNEPAPAPPTPAPIAANTQDQRYLDYVGSRSDLSQRFAGPDLIRAGRMACDTIGTPGISRKGLEQIVSGTQFGPAAAVPVVDAAEFYLCPGKAYYAAAPATDFSGYATKAAPTPMAAAPTSAPVTITGDVGNDTVGENIQPGRYRTAGGDTCYWAVITKAGNGDITDIKNRFGGGPQTVTLKVGQDFQTVSCGTWTKAG